MTTQFTHFNFHHRVVETLLPILVGVSLLFFNFHHRVVETVLLCVMLKDWHGFNFHHRVVETIILCGILIIIINFNFHHRVVETHHLRCYFLWYFPLTFTIGWLKRRPPERRGAEAPFNFHHRVVETNYNNDTSTDSTL
mgnify:CR=1 FL=1